MNKFAFFDQWIHKSEQSKWYLFLVNFGLTYMIPFNRGHRFKLTQMQADHFVVKVPYISRNKNHIRGIHACAQMTGMEMCSGIGLLYHFSAQKYRLIMKDIKIEYLLQGKEDLYAHFNPNPDQIKQWITYLDSNEKLDVHIPVAIKTAQGEVVAKSELTWQLKNWQFVKSVN